MQSLLNFGGKRVVLALLQECHKKVDHDAF